MGLTTRDHSVAIAIGAVEREVKKREAESKMGQVSLICDEGVAIPKRCYEPNDFVLRARSFTFSIERWLG
jgi:hypothetical protein